MPRSTKETTEEEIRLNDVPFWSSCRFALAFLGFLGFINVYAVRVNLSVAIVCMVNHTAFEDSNDTLGITSTECGVGSSGNTTSSKSSSDSLGGDFNWDKTVQGIILGSFFWGYLTSQIPAGWISMRFGGKNVFGISMLVASIVTLFTPLLAETHYVVLIILRIFLGCVTGTAFPAMHTMWGHWAPPMERSKLVAFTYAGAQVGVIVTFPLSGFLCKYGFAGGWPSIFYITGSAAFVWSIVWMFFISESPRTHKSISDVERDYIVQSLKEGYIEDKKKLRVPWCSIFTSFPVYAIIAANIASDWGANTLLLNIPNYINSVLKFDITSNGLISALPYIAFWLCILFGGWLADLVRNKKMLSTAVTRKAFTGFGTLVPAVLLIVLGYIDCSQPAVAIGLLVFAVSLTGFQYSGFLVNHVDIAPEFAGILFGLSNSIGSITGFLSSFIAGIITDSDPSRGGWQIVFYIAAGIYVFGAIFYMMFASGELQTWAQHPCSDKPNTTDDVELYEHNTNEIDKMIQGKQNFPVA